MAERSLAQAWRLLAGESDGARMVGADGGEAWDPRVRQYGHRSSVSRTAEAEVTLGLGRTVTLYHRSSTLYQIR